jgi:hypothetical protein
MEKMTKKQYFENLKGFVKGDANEADYVAFLDRQIELASKKRTAKTKTQIANEGLVEDIYEFIVATNGAVTVADIMGNFEGMSNQKVSALVKKLVDAGRVERAKDGKKTIYTIAD